MLYFKLNTIYSEHDIRYVYLCFHFCLQALFCSALYYLNWFDKTSSVLYFTGADDYRFYNTCVLLLYKPNITFYNRMTQIVSSYCINNEFDRSDHLLSMQPTPHRSPSQVDGHLPVIPSHVKQFWHWNRHRQPK